ncbi:hypothetical protein [Nicoliella lavandulae]|uniref:Uncharacterized protein n=1 Tax=Nicoliella lavandulae TaxID=3082954 RepID=A0ABU8SM81_9LACO
MTMTTMGNALFNAEVHYGRNIMHWDDEELKEFRKQYVKTAKGYRTRSTDLDWVHTQYDTGLATINLTAPRSYATYLICKLLSQGYNEDEIAEMAGVDRHDVSDKIRRYKRVMYSFTLPEPDGRKYKATTMQRLSKVLKRYGIPAPGEHGIYIALSAYDVKYSRYGKFVGTFQRTDLIRRVVLFDRDGNRLTEPGGTVKKCWRCIITVLQQ